MHHREFKSVNEIAKECIDIQDACNLRGVLKAWWDMLCSEHVARGGQAEEFINTLMISKVTSLLVAATDGIGGVDPSRHVCTFTDAYKWAKENGNNGTSKR